MEYEQLSPTIKKIFKRASNGDVVLPLNTEITCKVAGILCLIPSIISVLMLVVAGNSSSLFFILGALVFSLASFLLLGKRKRFVFDKQSLQLNLVMSIWQWGHKQQVVGKLTEFECVISRLENSGDFLVKFAGEQYHLKRREEAFAMVEFIATNYSIKCAETISDWPNKKAIFQTPVEHEHEYEKEQQSQQSVENNDLSNLGQTSFEIIKIWSLRSLLTLCIPFWVFTALAGFMQIWRQW